MAPRSKKGEVTNPTLETTTKLPKSNLKRKRLEYHSDNGLKIVKRIRVDHGSPAAASIKNGGSPLKDTTSDTSSLTTADEILTGTSATGLESDRSKQVSEVRHFSVEGDQVAEIITAYRNAMEILVEVGKRDRYKAYGQPHMGFGGSAPYSTPYGSVPGSTYATPYANAIPNSCTNPFSNPGPAQYVTPYANPPAVVEASGSSQNNAVTAQEAHTVDHPNLENPTAQVTSDNADIQMITNVENIEEIDETKDDDETSVSSVWNVDNFLALANGGVPLGQGGDIDVSDFDDGNQVSTATGLEAPPSPADTIDESLSRADEDVHHLVDHIANSLMRSKEYPLEVPPGNLYAAFYSTMNGKQLGAELKRLVTVAKPEVNAIMPREQIQAAHLFYTHLVSRTHTQNAASIRPPQLNHHTNFVPMNQWGRAVYPPAPPKGYMVQWHDSFTGAPSQAPPPNLIGQPFVPRGNVIAPPAVRNFEEEHKVATFGFPPKPGERGRPRTRGKRGRKKS